MKIIHKKSSRAVIFFLMLCLPCLSSASWIGSGSAGFVAHWITGFNQYSAENTGVKVDRVYINLPDYSIIFVSDSVKYVFEYTPASGSDMPENAKVIYAALMQALQTGETVNAYLESIDNANPNVYKFSRLMVIKK
ncbi:MAG: hypothetical protein PHC61_15420 [Chitinivibrionales bacterium]|nr:hypothetical protein [Chitinivibrionales bacterium]